jgi:hypothetical protein
MIIYEITPRGEELLKDRNNNYDGVPPEKLEILDKVLDDLFGKR